MIETSGTFYNTSHLFHSLSLLGPPHGPTLFYLGTSGGVVAPRYKAETRYSDRIGDYAIVHEVGDATVLLESPAACLHYSNRATWPPCATGSRVDFWESTNHRAAPWIGSLLRGFWEQGRRVFWNPKYILMKVVPKPRYIWMKSSYLLLYRIITNSKNIEF